MGKYKVDDEVWVMFDNGDKIGYVPAKGHVESAVVGNKYAFGTKEYSVRITPSISVLYDEHKIFESKEALFQHL